MLIMLLKILIWVVKIYIWVMIIEVIMSWLFIFNILSPSNDIVLKIREIIHNVTSPLLTPIRAILPSTGGFDFSFLVAFILLQLIESMLINQLLTQLTTPL